MIKKFIKVTDNLYRGSAPSIEDVKKLKSSFNINKIISLDKFSGELIDKTCKLNNIEHIIIPIWGAKIEPLMKLFSYDLKDLLINNGPTFVHCWKGKDRTGMVIAIFKCKYLNWSCDEAIAEAESLGFGIDVPQRITNLYKKIICAACKYHDHSNLQHNNDNNNADIIDNMRNDQIDHDVNMESFAPYCDTQVKNLYDNGPGIGGIENIQFGKGFVTI